METTPSTVISQSLLSSISSPKAERRKPNAELSIPSFYSEIRNPQSAISIRDSELFPPIQVISPELILVDWGPMTLTLSIWADDQPRPVMAVQAAIKALELLEQLAENQNLLKIPLSKLKNESHLPPLIKRAVSACRRVSGELTPMAAVAGLVGDELVRSALTLGGDRIIVNNGGDIALGLRGKQSIGVGLKDPFVDRISHVLDLCPEQGIGGVATSGWQGRSFSPGIADAVSVWASDCVTADAAATWIAGQMQLKSPKVIRQPAKELDPETDIPHLLITRQVNPLTPEEKETVLASGAALAQELITKGVIKGCYLAVQGSYRWIAFQEPLPRSLIYE